MTASVLTKTRTNARGLPARAVLVLQPPDHTTLVPVLLAPGVYHLGSDPGCEVVLNAPGIAPCHAQLVVETHGLRLRAIDSRTWVNDFLVTDTALRRGDQIAIGPWTFTLRPATPDDLLTQLPDAIEAEPVTAAVPLPSATTDVESSLAEIQADHAVVEAVALPTPPAVSTESVEALVAERLAEEIARWQTEGLAQQQAFAEQQALRQREQSDQEQQFARRQADWQQQQAQLEQERTEQQARWERKRAEQERVLAEQHARWRQEQSEQEEQFTRRQADWQQQQAQLEQERTEQQARWERKRGEQERVLAEQQSHCQQERSEQLRALAEQLAQWQHERSVQEQALAEQRARWQQTQSEQARELAEQQAHWQQERTEQERELAEIRTQLAVVAAGLEERESRLQAFETRLIRREDTLDQRHAETDAQRTALDAREAALTEERLRLESVADHARTELAAEAEKQAAAWAEWETTQRELAAQLNEQFAEIEAAEIRCATAKSQLEAEQQAWEQARRQGEKTRAEWEARREEQQLELVQWEFEAQQQRDELSHQLAQVEQQRADLNAEACQRAAAHRELLEARQETQRERRLFAEQQAAWMAEREAQWSDLRDRRRRLDADEREIADMRFDIEQTRKQLETGHVATPETGSIAESTPPVEPVAAVADLPAATVEPIDSVIEHTEETESVVSNPPMTDMADAPVSLSDVVETDLHPASMADRTLPADIDVVAEWLQDSLDELTHDAPPARYDDLLATETPWSASLPPINEVPETPSFSSGMMAAYDSAFPSAHVDDTGPLPQSWAEAWNFPAPSPVPSEPGFDAAIPEGPGFTEAAFLAETRALSAAMEAPGYGESPGYPGEFARYDSGVFAEAFQSHHSADSEPSAENTGEGLHARLAEMFGLPENFGHHDTPAEQDAAATEYDAADGNPTTARVPLETAADIPTDDPVENAAADEDWRSRLALMLAEPQPMSPSEPSPPPVPTFIPASMSPVSRSVEPISSSTASAEEDSIAAYMERLLARNKMASSTDEPAPPSKPRVMEPAPPPAPVFGSPGMVSDAGDITAANAEAQADESAEAPIEARPRVDKDEVRAALQSFRQVANLSARSALATHSSKTVRGELVVQGILSGLATVAAAGYWLSPLWGAPLQPIQATGCLIAAGWMGWQIRQSLNRLKNWNPNDHLMTHEDDVPAETELAESAENLVETVPATGSDATAADDSTPDVSAESATTDSIVAALFQEPTGPEPMGGVIGPRGDL